MAIAIALVVLLLGSVLFHFLSPWQLTEIASNWSSIDDTISISLWVTGFVFVAVNLFMAWCIVKYRYRPERRAKYEPENKKLEVWLTALTTIGIAGLLAPGLLTWGKFVTVPAGAENVEIIGQQWHWKFRFPGEDGRFGNIRPGLVGPGNPFGLDPEDPAGRDDILVDSPRVLLPVGQPVKAMLRSNDVIHNFQVAQFRAKMDLVPGQVSYVWLEPTRTGEFEILCAELCGIAHFAMRGMLEVVEQERFDQWLAEQPTFQESVDAGSGDPEAGQQLYATCTSCHGPQGQGNEQLNAPRIAGLEPWYVVRQLQNFKEGARGTHEDDTYGQQMRPFANTLANKAAMADVAAYIETLPVQPGEDTVTGNADRGEAIYRTCGACHGPDAQGKYAQNAPRLAGMSDWYLLRQLKHFKQGIRGGPDDIYGAQMGEMARTLGDEAAMRDVVAYINSLPAEPESAPDNQIAGRTQ